MSIIFKLTYFILIPFYSYMFSLLYMSYYLRENKVIGIVLIYIFAFIILDIFFIRVFRQIKFDGQNFEFNFKNFDFSIFLISIFGCLFLSYRAGYLQDGSFGLILFILFSARVSHVFINKYLETAQNRTAYEFLKYALLPISPLNGRNLNGGDYARICLSNIVLVLLWFVSLVASIGSASEKHDATLPALCVLAVVTLLFNLTAFWMVSSKGRLQEFN